jgi:predicted ATPase
VHQLPAGTVTFVFTDIEGSTRLLHELGDAYADVLAGHRSLIRAAFAERSGVEVDTQGDAFFYAFARASDAVAAAGHAQEGLAHGPVRVRIGVHTGEPVLTDEGYVGMDVHTAARIAACAHGGQVVVSLRAKELVAGTRAFTDLGVHRLKDLADPVHLFQLGNEPFPPLRSVNATNLPEPVSSFIGRRSELVSAAERLSDSRLLTITGPGGCGKTRFAIALAREALAEYPDGAWWVPLASLSDPQLVLPAIASSVGAPGDAAAYIARKRMLVVLDNVEHVLGAAPDIAALLAACPHLTVLATSRELLSIHGERRHVLAPLSDGEGTELFCDRAEVSPSDSIRELCVRLEGLPLAIELAAARAGLLSPEQILNRLSQRLDLFRGGRDADPRHATLRATIEWSDGLLTPEERDAFARFSVFNGGATFDAVEAVTGADPAVVQSLLDKSLIRRAGDRLWMFETIREYAAERLGESAGPAPVHERHARYYTEVARESHLSDDTSGVARHALALTEQGNFRAALRWATTGGDVELGLVLATALETFWTSTDPLEGARWFDALLSRAGDAPPQVRGSAFRAYGGVINPTGDDDLAERLYRQSLDEFRRAGDEDGIAGALVRIAHCVWYRGDIEEAAALGREGLDRGGNPRSRAQALGLLGELEFERGNHDPGLELLQESAATAEADGFVWWQARMLLRLGKRARELGRDTDAAAWALESLRLATGISDRRRLVQLLDLLAAVAADRGDPERAGVLHGAVTAELDREPVDAWSMTDLSSGADDPTFARAMRAGSRLSLSEAVAYALT